MFLVIEVMEGCAQWLAAHCNQLLFTRQVSCLTLEQADRIVHPACKLWYIIHTVSHCMTYRVQNWL